MMTIRHVVHQLLNVKNNFRRLLALAELNSILSLLVICLSLEKLVSAFYFSLKLTFTLKKIIFI